MSRPVSALIVTAKRDRWRQLIVAVGDIHSAESFSDSLACLEQPGDWQPECSFAVGAGAYDAWIAGSR
jgi:hypothetical protein